MPENDFPAGESSSTSADPTAQDPMQARKPRPGPDNTKLLNVEPLKREEMQPSYEQELTVADSQGWYGSMINCLGTIAGNLGSVPCCICCPNPYKEV